MGNPVDLLETLLAKTEADYTAPSLSARKLVLYGAGTLGRSVLKRLRAGGIEPIAFADDTPAKEGTVIDDLEILPPEQIATRFGSDVVFAVTILNPALCFLDAKKRLLERTGREALSLLALARAFPDALMPCLQYDRPAQILGNAPHIRRAFQILSDDRSREEFVAHLNFRLTARYDLLPAKSQPPYFPPGLIGEFSSDCTFVDCGAYDGDTIRQFLQHQRGQFGTIFAFEPDKRNFESLRNYVRSLGTDIASRIHLHHGAVGDHSGEAPFDDTGDMSAAVRPDATGKVKLFALDDVVRSSGSDVYLKFDIEGFEQQALNGARSLLRSQRPAMAVSAYHRPADLWEIPLYLHDLGIGYRLALRTEGDDGMDLVCYALPARG
jgi:FkbM family methyltransferase